MTRAGLKPCVGSAEWKRVLKSTIRTPERSVPAEPSALGGKLHSIGVGASHRSAIAHQRQTISVDADDASQDSECVSAALVRADANASAVL